MQLIFSDIYKIMKIQFYPALTLYRCLDLSPYFTDVFIHNFQNVTKPVHLAAQSFGLPLMEKHN